MKIEQTAKVKTAAKFASGLVLALAAGLAQATILTDTMTFNGGLGVLLNDGNTSFSYTQDFTDPPTSFVVGSDSIVSASLKLTFHDVDADRSNSNERANISIDGALVASDLDLSSNSWQYTYDFSSPYTALLDGILDGMVVTVQTNGGSVGNPKIGDFYFDQSILTLNVTRVGQDPVVASVPEPGTLFLMGSALAGFGFGTRRRGKTGK